jgi:hypothetical protein
VKADLCLGQHLLEIVDCSIQGNLIYASRDWWQGRSPCGLIMSCWGHRQGVVTSESHSFSLLWLRNWCASSLMYIRSFVPEPHPKTGVRLVLQNMASWQLRCGLFCVSDQEARFRLCWNMQCISPKPVWITLDNFRRLVSKHDPRQMCVLARLERLRDAQIWSSRLANHASRSTVFTESLHPPLETSSPIPSQSIWTPLQSIQGRCTCSYWKV